jgi:hypothetical protein
MRKDHGSPSVNTTTGSFISSFRRLMMRRVRARWLPFEVHQYGVEVLIEAVLHQTIEHTAGSRWL